MRASKHSMTSLKRLKIERCASSKMIRSKKPGLQFRNRKIYSVAIIPQSVRHLGRNRSVFLKRH